ncbi:hypothetical protein PIB30_036303 [Stylosanthes scabra]|uniref:Uncharacterized protein n=1 Tax=Stylosanthes scabra TaxID=79078 RepID=A0ABU6RDX3_9FABA|nr:hypothetical protein [Stylosanthes scabra]
MRATAYLHLFARGASSQGVVHQTYRVFHVPVLPVRTHGSPSRMLRSGGTKEDTVKALPPLDVSILPSDEQTTPASTPTVHIPDVPGFTVATVLHKTNEDVPVSLFCDACTNRRWERELRVAGDGAAIGAPAFDSSCKNRIEPAGRTGSTANRPFTGPSLLNDRRCTQIGKNRIKPAGSVKNRRLGRFRKPDRPSQIAPALRRRSSLQVDTLSVFVTAARAPRRLPVAFAVRRRPPLAAASSSSPLPAGQLRRHPRLKSRLPPCLFAAAGVCLSAVTPVLRFQAFKSVDSKILYLPVSLQ